MGHAGRNSLQEPFWYELVGLGEGELHLRQSIEPTESRFEVKALGFRLRIMSRGFGVESSGLNGEGSWL